MFHAGNEIFKMYFKTSKAENKQTQENYFLTESKLNSIEKTISKAPTNTEINHEEFTLVSKESENYRRL